MSTITFPFENYYLSDFIDPLYRPYINRNVFNINPLTMNINEIRYQQGLTFKKKHSNFPCPFGFGKKFDYCERLAHTTKLSGFYHDESIDNGLYEFIKKTSMISENIYPDEN